VYNIKLVLPNAPRMYEDKNYTQVYTVIAKNFIR